MADVLYQAVREGINQKLIEQVDGTYAQNYVAAPQQALPTDVLYQAIREGVYKKLVLQPDGSYAEVIVVAGGGSGNFQFVPYMRFVVPITGSGQTFTNTNLTFYFLAEDIDLFLNGVKLDSTTYTLLGNTLTINRNLNLNDVLTIDSKVISTVGPTVSYRLLENGLDRRLTEDGNLRILERFVS